MKELPQVGKKYRILWLSTSPNYINDIKVTRVETNKKHGTIITFRGYGLFPASSGSISLSDWEDRLVEETE